jgi:hypothetical protein
MLEFDDSARSEAPPEEVGKILYAPARFMDWWDGMETTSVGDGEFTFQQVGIPELQIPNRLEVRQEEQTVVISCLLHDLSFSWRLEPLDNGQATHIAVHVEIPANKVQRLARSQQAAIRASVRRLAELAAQPESVATHQDRPSHVRSGGRREPATFAAVTTTASTAANVFP